jgi:hypothetical protein
LTKNISLIFRKLKLQHIFLLLFQLFLKKHKIYYKFTLNIDNNYFLLLISGVRHCPDRLCGHLWRVGLPGGGRSHHHGRQGSSDGSGKGNNSRMSGSGRCDRQVGEGRALRVGDQASGLGGGDGAKCRILKIA